MGCGLRKLKPSEDSSPGKIYSTLKRPQVETKVGVSYTYRFLDFLIGKDDGTSTLRLVSVRELPSQLQELYQQGFVLAAVHPFIHPCGPDSTSTQHQLYRAVLSRLNEGCEKTQSLPDSPYRLQLEECLSGDLVPTPELIQGYVKKQIQDAGDQGIMFVGFIQEPRGAPASNPHREPETPSLSLHSSPSSVIGSLGSCSPTTPRNHGELGSPNSLDPTNEEDQDSKCEVVGEHPTRIIGESELSGVEVNHDRGSSQAISPSSEEPSQVEMEEDAVMHNNNKTNASEEKERPSHYSRRNGLELLALFNHPTVRESQLKYYTVKVPLRVQLRDEGVKGVEANWLDHMTQHFNNGASLVDGYFHLGNENDLLPKLVESVFIFQEATEGDSNAAATTYDAIVVEQWTVIDGLQVKTDYVPLLQSLAMYGWRLTCVLPTPIIKTNSDGSLSTKQIVFLQRPILPRKSRESKKLIFKNRSKSNKNSVKDGPKIKKKKNKPSEADKNLEDPKILEDGEKSVKEDSMSLNEENGDIEEKVKKAEVDTEHEDSVKPELRTMDETEGGVEAGKMGAGDEGTKVSTGLDKRAEEQAEARVKTDQKKAEMETVDRVANRGAEVETETIMVAEREGESKNEEHKEEETEIEEVKDNGIEAKKEREVNEESRILDCVAMQQDAPKQEEAQVQEEITDEVIVNEGVILTSY